MWNMQENYKIYELWRTIIKERREEEIREKWDKIIEECNKLGEYEEK